MKFRLQHLGDLVTGLLLYEHLVNARAKPERAVAELPHLGFGGHDTVARYNCVEIQLERRVERRSPLLGAASAGVVDKLRGRVAEREHVTGGQRPLRREIDHDVAVCVGAAKVVELDVLSPQVDVGVVLEDDDGRPGCFPSTLFSRASSEATTFAFIC